MDWQKSKYVYFIDASVTLWYTVKIIQKNNPPFSISETQYPVNDLVKKIRKEELYSEKNNHLHAGRDGRGDAGHTGRMRQDSDDFCGDFFSTGIGNAV